MSSLRTRSDGAEPSSPRETEIVLRLAAFRYLGASQVCAFLFDGSSVSARSRTVITRRILGRLRSRGLVATTPRLVGGPGGGSARLTHYLTRAGYRLARSLDPLVPLRRLRSPGSFLIRHGLLTAEIALAFRQEARLRVGHELVAWDCDWQAALALGASAVLPDAHLVYRTPEGRLHAFLEVDLGSERTPFFARKVRRYLDLYRSGSWRSRLPLWPLVLTVAETEARATQLRRISEAVLVSQPDRERLARATEFRFASATDLLGPAGPLGEIWQVAGRSGRHALAAEARAGADRGDDSTRDALPSRGSDPGGGTGEDLRIGAQRPGRNT